VWVTAANRHAVVEAYADAAERVLRAERDDPARAAEESLA
jgi:hypothetical protein